LLLLIRSADACRRAAGRPIPKATKLGVKVIDENEFRRLLAGGD